MIVKQTEISTDPLVFFSMIDLQNYEYNFALYRRVRLFLQLFVEGRMSYLRDLYLFANSGVQHILVFALFVFVLCLVCPVLPVSLDWPFDFL